MHMPITAQLRNYSKPSIPEGFAPTLHLQGKGCKCPIKTQLRNDSKLENAEVMRVSPCLPQPWHPSPVGVAPRGPVPRVKLRLGLHGVVWGPFLRTRQRGLPWEHLALETLASG